MLSRSLEETRIFAADFIRRLQPRERASVVALEGDLGAGKTSFVQGAARSLGITEQIQSPTFVILKAYDIVHPHWKHLIHIDAYRLENERELERLSWETYASDPGNLILVEWPERVAGLIPHDAERVTFSFVDENTREIEI